MNLQTILIISLTSYLTFLRAESLCYQSGKTWSSFGQIALIPEVSSVQACIQFCREYDNCNGYTWLGITNQRLSNVCVLFKDLDLEHDCKNCISGKMSDLENCICDQNNEECVVSTENFILAIPTLTETECFLECSLELVSKELNHLAAILHVCAGGLIFMK